MSRTSGNLADALTRMLAGNVFDRQPRGHSTPLVAYFLHPNGPYEYSAQGVRPMSTPVSLQVTVTGPRQFISTIRTIHAVQYTGRDSILALQAFLAPDSPMFNDKAIEGAQTLGVFVRNREDEARWPNLGKQYKMVFAPVGSWIMRDEAGDVAVITDVEFRAQYTEGERVG